MRRLNIFIYILHNLIWALLVFLSVFKFISKVSDLYSVILVIMFFSFSFFQIYGFRELLLNRIKIPVICNLLFIPVINLEGFKYISSPSFFLNLGVKNSDYFFNAGIFNDPYLLLNLTFSELNIQYLAINILPIIFVVLLYNSYQNLEPKKKYF